MLRGALLAIHRGQTEAAMAIGLTFRQTFQSVLMPQALRQILPTWVNAATEMVKASTLLSVIGVVELLLATQQVISRNFLSLEFYFFAGFVYFVIDFSIERLGRFVETKVAFR
jgi:polar amino acid transport system permease protein